MCHCATSNRGFANREPFQLQNAVLFSHTHIKYKPQISPLRPPHNGHILKSQVSACNYNWCPVTLPCSVAPGEPPRAAWAAALRGRSPPSSPAPAASPRLPRLLAACGTPAPARVLLGGGRSAAGRWGSAPWPAPSQGNKPKRSTNTQCNALNINGTRKGESNNTMHALVLSEAQSSGNPCAGPPPGRH